MTDESEGGESSGGERAFEGMLRELIRSIPVAVAMFDTEMRYLEVSETWRKDNALLGVDLLGRRHYDVVPHVPERWREVHRRALAGSSERSDQDCYVRPDGVVEWLRWECRPWRRPGGEVGGIILSTQVITEQVVALESLRESEERLRLVAENVREVFWLSDVSKSESSRCRGESCWPP